MPFVITTIRGPSAYDVRHGESRRLHTSVAVATLDEARSKVIAQIDLHGHARDRRLAHATADDLVTEQGGKVSLPDGGEIEVAALALVDLAYRAGMRDRWLVAASATEVCDAYNARAEG